MSNTTDLPDFKYTLDLKAIDFFTVFRPLFFIWLFQALILYAFTGISQGQDMLLTLLVDSSSNQFALFWLFISLFLWSISSEFGSRLVLYFSDTSTHNIHSRRVRFRKKTQRRFTKALLYAPSIMLAIGFIKAYIRAMKIRDELLDSQNTTGEFIYIICVLFFLWLMLYLIYFRKTVLRKKLYVLKLKRSQSFILAKLYSILKPRLVSVSNDSYINPAELKDEKQVRELELPVNGLHYFNPLVKRFILFVIAAFGFIFLFSLIKISWYSIFGSTALICLAFACWIIVYCLLDIMDKAQPFLLKIPYKVSFICILLLMSYFNKDHPARHFKENTSVPVRKPIAEYFDDWVVAKGFDKKEGNFPVVFVGAEGGALRTGAFTSFLLAYLQQRDFNFREHVFSLSSVSGGSLGSNLFNSFNLINLPAEKYVSATQTFYQHDFLAPVTGKLVFADVLNLFWPRTITPFDRARALEIAWEEAWQDATHTKQNVMSMPFDSGAGNTSNKGNAVVLINILEAESGYRTIWSNVKIDHSFKRVVDLRSSSKYDLHYSTAISLSARFPMVSPGGAIELRDNRYLHYVDGGYFENKGALTTAEAIEAIKTRSKYGARADVYVLQFNFSEDGIPKPDGIKFGNEIAEIVMGIYNARGGHTDYSLVYMKSIIHKYNGRYINMDMTQNSKDVPMNWVLSRAAINSIEKLCKVSMLGNDSLNSMMNRIKEYRYKPVVPK